MSKVKSSYVTARIEPKLKKEGERVLNKIGLSTTDAITIFFKQVAMRGGIPFDVRIPNKTTKTALRENPKHSVRYKSVEEMMKDVWPST